jgi:uncharacterized membrane protein YphA (DoxX/SURF4 family)
MDVFSLILLLFSFTNFTLFLHRWEGKATIGAQPPATLSYSKTPPTPVQIHVATLLMLLLCIGLFKRPTAYVFLLTSSVTAYLLNLCSSDIPFNLLFQAYFVISKDWAILFIDSSKILGDDVRDYLKLLDVEQKEHNDLWAFLHCREWGEGKVKCSNRKNSFM